VIDWYFVFVHALWILGLSIVLAAFSYHNWVRQEANRKLLVQLNEPGCRLMLNVGMSLVAVSFVLMRTPAIWERGAWCLLAVGCLWNGWTAWRGLRRSRPAEPTEGHAS
jgi:protein-S-isoprenylcysteine O-methyltransferase Ste14